MTDRIRAHLSLLAELSVNGHRLALPGEKRQRQPIELPVVGQEVRPDALAQERPKIESEFFQIRDR